MESQSDYNFEPDQHGDDFEVEFEAQHDIWWKRREEASLKPCSQVINCNNLTAHQAPIPHEMLRLELKSTNFFSNLDMMVFQAAIMISESNDKLSAGLPLRDVQVYQERLSQSHKDNIDGFLQAHRKNRQVHVAVGRTLKSARKFGMNHNGAAIEEELSRRIQPKILEEGRPQLPAVAIKSASKMNLILTSLDQHLDLGISIKLAAKSDRIQPREVYRLKYLLKSNPRAFAARFERELVGNRTRRPRTCPQLGLIIQQQLRATSGALNLKQLQAVISTILGKDSTPSLTKLTTTLKELKFTRKKVNTYPIERNSQTTKNRRFIFFCEYVLALALNRKLIAIDETAVAWDTNNRFHYAPAGTTWCHHSDTQRQQHLTGVFAVSQQKVEQVVFTQGSCLSALYSKFIIDLVNSDPAFKHSDLRRRPVLVMDNAQIHNVKALRLWLVTMGVHVLWSPPYSPFCNPVEFMNGYLKELISNSSTQNL